MSDYLAGIGTMLGLELRRRVRGIAWYVLLGVFILLEFIVTLLLTLAFGAFADGGGGSAIYSAVIYFSLLLATLVVPALSGNSINGDRDGGTLATTQVTLVTAGQILVGKFLSAWITALAFLAASLPFVIWAVALGGSNPAVLLSSAGVLAVELGVVAAFGVGLSGLISRPLLSVAVSYLAIAALSVGTLIAFGLGTISVQTPTTYEYRQASSYDDSTGIGQNCTTIERDNGTVPRYDYFWGLLAANPYVVVADATPTTYTDGDSPDDLFGYIKLGVRSAQIAPGAHELYDECAPDGGAAASPTARQIIDSTVPSWFVGLLVHVVLAAGAMLGAWARLRTPARTLSRGSRIA